jgi:NagD protein
MNFERLKNVKCFLLDMDGTFYLGDKIFDFSLDFIKAVKDSKRDYMFLTNNSSHNALFYKKRLSKMGLNISEKKIITSGIATADYLNKHYANKTAFLLGNDYLKNELEENGVQIDNLIQNPDYIILGFDTTLDYKKMTKVCTLARKGTPMIATHPDINCPTENGDIPDIGAIMSFVETSTGKKPDAIIGKPNHYIFDSIIKRANLKKSEIAMVGDRLYTDIKSGQLNNILSILVLSGETNKQMLKHSSIKPDYTFENIGEIAKVL